MGPSMPRSWLCYSEPWTGESLSLSSGLTIPTALLELREGPRPQWFGVKVRWKQSFPECPRDTLSHQTLQEPSGQSLCSPLPRGACSWGARGQHKSRATSVAGGSRTNSPKSSDFCSHVQPTARSPCFLHPQLREDGLDTLSEVEFLCVLR